MLITNIMNFNKQCEFSVELLKHSVGIDTLFHNPKKWSSSHADEVTKDLYDKANELALFGDIYGFEEKLRR